MLSLRPDSMRCPDSISQSSTAAVNTSVDGSGAVLA
jgi:hypothetical protein